MKNHILITLFILILTNAKAQEISSKVASMYVFNFTKYIKWPESSVGNEFVIGIVAKNEVFEEFNKMAALKNYSNKKISLKNLSQNADFSDCNLIYIGTGKDEKLKEYANFSSSKPILFIGETENSTRKGAGIALFIDEEDGNKTKFHIDKEKIEKRGLKVANELMMMSE